MTGGPSPDDVLARLRRCLPEGGECFPLHAPEFSEAERRYVLDCVDSGWVSSVGAYVDRFEQDLATLTGAARAVACVNATAGLQVALRLVGVRPGDEVLIPALTFVGTANAVVALGAVPHLLDVDERTLGLDPAAARQHLSATVVSRDGQLINHETGRRLAAVVVVHVFGHPVDLDGWTSLCEELDLPLVEDAAESLGSTWRDRHCGTFGRVGVLSFNGNKIVTTGGGGALLTGDHDLADRAKHLTTTAKVPHRWEYVHDEVAYNFRLPNINAALGCGQLEQLPRLLEQKRELAERYRTAFADLKGLRVVLEPEHARSNYWLNALLLEPEHQHLRDSLLEATNAAGIQTRPAWTPMHRLSMYRSCPRSRLPVTESLAARLVNVPSSPSLVTAR